MRNTTIVDIAKLAGVSKSTVSRVVTGNGSISPDARDKVLKAMKELNYKPNHIARTMISRKSNNIGVIIFRDHYPVASHPYYGRILDSILAEAGNLNYSVFVSKDEEMSNRAIDFMLEKRVDGLILMSMINEEIIAEIMEQGIPFVTVNYFLENDQVVQVLNKDMLGGRLAAEYLYNLGHREIGFISGPQEKNRSHGIRAQQFEQTLNDLNCPLLPGHKVSQTESSFQNGYKSFMEIWDNSKGSLPTAIFATSDLLALGAMKAMKELGVRIPEDISIVGFDNIQYAEYSTPALTTFHIQKKEIGKKAVEVLELLIQNNDLEKKQYEFEPELIIRESAISIKSV